VRGDFYNRRRKKSIDHDGRRHPTATGPHSRLLSIQQSTNILFDRITLLKLEKVIISLTLIMFISYSKARCVDESLSVMFASRAADAEHQRRQRWHIYVVYVSSHGP